MTRGPRATLVLLALAGALPALAPAARAQGVREGRGAEAAIIAEVNGTPLTRADLDEALEMDDEWMRLRRLGNDRGAQELRRKAESRVLDQLIDEVLLTDAARAARITLSADEERDVERFFEERVKEGWGSVDQLEEMLKARGLKLEKLKTRNRNGFLIRKLASEEASKAAFVRPAEILRYYEDHRAGMRRGGTFACSLILVSKRTRSREEASVLIEGALRELLAGKAFEEVAKEYPDGPYADQGGRQKWKSRNDIRSDWRALVADLKAGERSGVIETKDAFMIVRIDADAAETERPLEEVHDEIHRKLEDEARRERLAAMTERMRAQAFVKRRPGAPPPFDRNDRDARSD